MHWHLLPQPESLFWPLVFSRLKAQYVATMNAVLHNRLNPQKNEAQSQLVGKMAAPTGLPIKIPSAPKNMFRPNRLPMERMSVVMDATQGPWRETKAPAQNP